MIDKILHIFGITIGEPIPTPWKVQQKEEVTKPVNDEAVVNSDVVKMKTKEKKIVNFHKDLYVDGSYSGFEADLKLSVAINEINVTELKRRQLSVNTFEKLLPDLSSYDRWSDLVDTYKGKYTERTLEKYRSAYNFMKMNPLPKAKTG